MTVSRLVSNTLTLFALLFAMSLSAQAQTFEVVPDSLEAIPPTPEATLGELQPASLPSICGDREVYFDGRCRTRKFFSRLTPSGSSLIDVFGCYRLTEKNSNPNCGKYVYIIERVTPVTTRTILLSNMEQGQQVKGKGSVRITGISSIKSATLKDSNMPVTVDLPKRGKYQAISIETENVNRPNSTDYGISKTTRYYNSYGHLLGTTDNVLNFAKNADVVGNEYNVSGNICELSEYADAKKGENVTCSCIDEGTCLKDFRFGGAAPTNGSSLTCEGDECRFCSTSYEKQKTGGWLASEMNLDFVKTYDIVKTGPTQQTSSGVQISGVKREWNGCYAASGLQGSVLLANNSESSENEGSNLCGPEIRSMYESYNSLCEAKTLAHAALTAYGSLIYTAGFELGTGGVNLTTIDSQPVSIKSAFNLGSDAVDAGYIGSSCGMNEVIGNVTLETSMCQAKSNFGSCDGEHKGYKVKFTNNKTGQICTVEADLYCVSKTSSPTSMNSTDCSCQLQSVDQSTVQCGGN